MLLSHYNESLIEAVCDEAGRGCLAGAVYAAAVILPPDYHNDMLNDSKQLTERRRYILRGEIERDAVAWAVGIVTPEEIDRINILRASFLAMHRAIETSAYCSGKVFSAVLERVDYVMMDLKLMDPERHRHYTGVPNEPILENLERLKKSGKPFRIRIPVIPGVNDSDENFEQTALRLTDAPALEQVELLPYHVTAGAKYAMVGRQYRPEFDTAAAPNLNTGIFLAHGIACTHL